MSCRSCGGGGQVEEAATVERTMIRERAVEPADPCDDVAGPGTRLADLVQQLLEGRGADAWATFQRGALTADLTCLPLWAWALVLAVLLTARRVRRG